MRYIVVSCTLFFLIAVMSLCFCLRLRKTAEWFVLNYSPETWDTWPE